MSDGPFDRAVGWLFADRSTGQIVVVQAPNATLWVFLAALAASFVVPAGRAATAVTILQVGALAFWAFDEAARGVNPWRRMLGVATLLAILIWLVR